MRIPEITIRRSGGYEVRAKAWVYEDLLKLKELGFGAVLGKTMAEEFNRQVARIYVERALTNLGFLPEDYDRERPLAKLQERQKEIYSRALELDFNVPLEKGYYLSRQLKSPLTWEREKELLEFLKNKLSREEFEIFCQKMGITDEYFKTREIIETFLNFASDWGWQIFDRSNEFPIELVRWEAGGGFRWGGLQTRSLGFKGRRICYIDSSPREV